MPVLFVYVIGVWLVAHDLLHARRLGMTISRIRTRSVVAPRRNELIY
jgi:hypothetical protein